MQENYQTTAGPTTAADVGVGDPPNAEWNDINNILVDDSTFAWLGIYAGGQQGDDLVASDFTFDLPPHVVIDGLSVSVTGLNDGTHGTVGIGLAGSDTVDAGALNGSYGGSTDLWGLDEITIADLSDLAVTISMADDAGGDGIAWVYYVSVTIYWHIEMPSVEADVPTRIDYQVYSRDGNYLGLLPNVSSDLAFPEDINTAGTSIVITCGKYVNNEVTVTPLLDESGNTITTEDDLPILATETDLLIARGDSPDEAIFKNSNRIRAWLYNKYHPNGKLMFSGQVNRVNFKYGGGDASVALTVYSDGQDLDNFVARGYPFSYSTDVSQTSQNGYVTVTQSGKTGGWERYGQTWQTGASVTNLGAFTLRLRGSANVTLSFYDNVGGNLIGSVSKYVSVGSATDVQFDTAQLIGVESSRTYFVTVSVGSNQSMRVYKHGTSSTYANGTMWHSSYSGGSGGGQYFETTGDFYFISKYGTPTTTATYSSQDPVSGMASGIFADYNNRGGLITERDFEATGLSLSYTFVVSFIYDALKKILELCPTGYYAYVDVGTAEIDIKQTSTSADFTIVKGRHINELNIDMTIEQVKNYLLFTGGDTGGGVNLYRDYPDAESSAFYGLRTDTKTDNRVTLNATADAIGETFIEENSDEVQQTSLTVLNEYIDITLLTPGKTIGFRNFGNFIDDLVLQVVRREGNYSKGTATLTLGRLPIRLSSEIQRINRQLLNEQTIDNPSAPS